LRRRIGDAARLLEVMQQLAGEVIDAMCFRRRLEFAGGAQKQLSCELAFQQRDALRDGRLADAKLVGRGGETAAFHDTHEGAQTIDAVHR
jgi:hypothetical protein